jgi:hypothetical protein
MMQDVSMKQIIILSLFVLASGCAIIKPKTHTLGRYGNLTGFLQGFCDEYAKEDLNMFYISDPVSSRGEQDSQGDYAHVYWMTGNLITIIKLPVQPQSNYYWWRYNAGIELDKNVVPSVDDVGQSTYLMASEWVKEMIIGCITSGHEVVIGKNANKALDDTSQ